MKNLLRISIGIPAYNEEENIGKLLAALLNQKTDKIRIEKIIVVSSGCTDRTNDIVEEFSENDDKILLIKQDRREGKASAINEFLKVADSDVLVLESADTIPEKETIERLCFPFIDEKVGMAGAHPIPVNNKDDFMGYVVHLLWGLHHCLALKSPKCGELVAFRKVFDSIPKDVAVDEAWIEHEIRMRGLRVVYVPEAIVYNKGPETVWDFLKQRRRISYGHLDLHRRTGYKVSSWSVTLLLPVVSKIFPYKSPREWGLFISAFALEALGRLLGYYDYLKKKRHEVWEISRTTKSLEVNVC